VLYNELVVVSWNDTGCVADYVETTTFDVGDVKNKPALTFYTRYHLQVVKIPELEASIASTETSLKRVQNKDKICCTSTKGVCLGETRQCDDNDIKEEEQKLKALKTALEGWTSTLEMEGKKSDISGWFDNESLNEVMDNKDAFTMDEDQTRKDLDIENHGSALAPEELIKGATALEDAKVLLQKRESDITKTQRIQFAGDSGLYQMTLNRDAMSSFSEQNCNPLFRTSFLPGSALAGFAKSASIPVSLVALLEPSGPTINAINGCNYEFDLSVGAHPDFESNLLGVDVEASGGFGELHSFIFKFNFECHF
jgi:hypothetical protein